MKRLLLLFLIAVAFALPTRAAVELTNLNRGDFIVDPTAAPTNVVILNLPHGGAPDLPGDIISLVGGTNFWAVVGGNLHPKVLNNIVQVTNLISYDVLTANNEFVIQASFSTNLVAGANQLPTWHVGFARLSSDAASTTPADRTVTLQGASGSAQGQLLFLENIWGVLGTQPSAFTLANGSALWGPGTGIVVLQNGDWAPTQNGEGLFLMYDGSSWHEVARFFGPGGGSGNALINPTVNYLPKRGPATNLVDSLVHDDGSYVYVDGTGTATVELESDDGQIIWGTGATNVLYRSGRDLVYTNGYTDVKFQVLNGAGNGALMEAQGTTATFGVAGASTTVGLRAGADQVGLFSGAFYPVVSLSEGNGLLTKPWRETSTSNLWVVGYSDILGTSYSRMAVNQAGTNSPFVFDIQTVGSGVNGVNQGFQFQTNGGTAFSVAANSGYAGGGTLFLSDDGTYKAAGGAGPWTESPTGTASLVAGVTNVGITDTITANTNTIASSNNLPTWNGSAWPDSFWTTKLDPIFDPELGLIPNTLSGVMVDGRTSCGFSLMGTNLAMDIFGNGSYISDLIGGFSTPDAVNATDVGCVKYMGFGKGTNGFTSTSAVEIFGCYCGTNDVPTNKPVVAVVGNHFLGVPMRVGEPIFAVIDDYAPNYGGTMGLVVVNDAVSYTTGNCLTGINTNRPSASFEVTSFSSTVPAQKWSLPDGTVLGSVSTNGNLSMSGIVSSDSVVATNTVKAGYANAWKLGAVKTCSAVTVVLTNYIEIVIDGTTNSIPILNVTP